MLPPSHGRGIAVAVPPPCRSSEATYPPGYPCGVTIATAVPRRRPRRRDSPLPLVSVPSRRHNFTAIRLGQQSPRLPHGRVLAAGSAPALPPPCRSSAVPAPCPRQHTPTAIRAGDDRRGRPSPPVAPPTPTRHTLAAVLCGTTIVAAVPRPWPRRRDSTSPPLRSSEETLPHGHQCRVAIAVVTPWPRPGDRPLSPLPAICSQRRPPAAGQHIPCGHLCGTAIGPAVPVLGGLTCPINIQIYYSESLQ